MVQIAKKAAERNGSPEHTPRYELVFEKEPAVSTVREAPPGLLSTLKAQGARSLARLSETYVSAVGSVLQGVERLQDASAAGKSRRSVKRAGSPAATSTSSPRQKPSLPAAK
jgi:hypothetical protein